MPEGIKLEGIGWGNSRNSVRADTDKLVIELETFDFGMSDAHQNLAKWRALKAATRAINEVERMSKEEVDREWKSVIEESKRYHWSIVSNPMEG